MTLSDFILHKMEAILSEWEKFARTIPAAADLDAEDLRDHCKKILQAISRDLVQSQSAEQQSAKSKGEAPSPVGKDTAATSHGSDRHTEGFDLNALVAEYRALRATVIRLWTCDVSSGDREIQFARFNEAIDQALHESVCRYSEELNQSRELFLGILGHDLGTPLGATLLSAQYLLRTEGLSGDQIKAAAAILNSGTRIRKITSDLLDVTRTRLGGSLPIEPRPMDLFRVCQQVTEDAHASHPDRMVKLISTGDLRGTWDETRLYQLLSNLVENAIRHGAGEQPVKVTAVGGVEEVKITVHNHGAAIPRSEISRIFEPMRQGEDRFKHAEGLGLGLYIARIIARAHHGAIDAESSSDTGTTFTVRIPRHHPVAGRRAAADRRAEDRAGSERRREASPRLMLARTGGPEGR